jgi:hypothetical protein
MNQHCFSLPIITLVFASATLGLVSCASGPTYAEIKSKLPPITQGNGRVFVYRPSSFGFAVKPSVKIDDAIVGTSMGQGFFYSDQKAGSHQISIASEWNHKVSLSVENGQPTFISCSVIPGVFVAHILPNQVDKATGEAAIQDCKMQEK